MMWLKVLICLFVSLAFVHSAILQNDRNIPRSPVALSAEGLGDPISEVSRRSTSNNFSPDESKKKAKKKPSGMEKKPIGPKSKEADIVEYKVVPTQFDSNDPLPQPPDDGLDFTIDPDLLSKEKDVSVMVKKFYQWLAKRMASLNRRVSRAEKMAQNVEQRLAVVDCADLQVRGKPSGSYTVFLDHAGKRPLKVVCDMDTAEGGWTIIQRRIVNDTGIDFNRGWREYKVGFGNLSSDFWIGLENIYALTHARNFELRIELTDYEGEKAYAQYDTFYIDGESKGYKLHVSGFSGNAGDSLTNEGKPDNFTANDMMFSTYDEDHDTSHQINCSQYWKIGGWWFNRCSWANLNGPRTESIESTEGIGINWHKWRNKQKLRSSLMMIRPRTLV